MIKISKKEYDNLIDLKKKVVEFLEDLENDFPKGPLSTYNQPAGCFISETKRFGRELTNIIDKGSETG